MSNDTQIPGTQSVLRYRILFKGIVQGVGFRPYLYKTAKTYNLTGFVKNTSEGVILEVEGKNIQDFITYTFDHLPPLSKVVDHKITKIDLAHSTTFDIHSSESTSKSDLLVSPDIAVCDNCTRELLDPQDRRNDYPFINCTDCGPRLTIIRDLPYDRPLTTMSVFPMCETCAKEYGDPMDRRYHAQPVSCYKCGPALSLYDVHQPEKRIDDPGLALAEACRQLKAGKLAAIKGLGGYHLACLASSDKAVSEMRRRKGRERKPFALMGTPDMIKMFCGISEDEEKHLLAPSAPILLLKRKETGGISQHVAPGQNTIGFMAPYTPLHILILKQVGEPLVMTSANFTDEPIIHKDDSTGLPRLADVVLTHDREIYLFADDSVARVVEGKMYTIRRSRGYVPYPVPMPFHLDKTVLGLGPMLKTTFTFWRGDKAISSPYIGTTDTPEAIRVQRFALGHYMKLFAFEPETVAVDAHPGYPNRLLARDFKAAKIVEIQHHRAHVASLMAEKAVTGPIIGISFDGTGYGDDGKIWGGEFFTGDYKKLDRFGHLKYLFLPAGDKSVKEPWRFSLSLLHSLYGEGGETLAFAERFGKRGSQQLEIIKKRMGGVLTSSSGRIFDAAACLLGVGELNYFDGDLPSQLQSIAESCGPVSRLYPFTIDHENGTAILNLLPLFDEMLKDAGELPERAFRFHASLAAAIAAMAEQARERTGIRLVGLTGGVFQNTLLLRLTMDELRKREFELLIHSMVPSNDGGISVGQAFLAGSL
jgi:hydrogenase maturation protein HypF